MADNPNEVVKMYHSEASPDEPVEVTRFEYESVWKAVGWKLRPAATTTKDKEK